MPQHPGIFWRWRPDLNWWMRVLQTLALPLGHVTIFGATIAAPFGAADEARTRYLHLGKVALYQMSYGRILETLLGFLDWCLRSESNQWHGDFQSPALPTELQRRTGRWLLYLKFRFCKGVNAKFFENFWTFYILPVLSSKIRLTFLTLFAGGRQGKTIWHLQQPMV